MNQTRGGRWRDGERERTGKEGGMEGGREGREPWRAGVGGLGGCTKRVLTSCMLYS